MENKCWQPEYAERYYAVDEKSIENLKSDQNLHLSVHRYMWLDIDDDYQYAAKGLVFQNEQDALTKAREIYEEMEAKRNEGMLEGHA